MRRNLLLIITIIFILSSLLSLNFVCFADTISDNSTYYEAVQDIICYSDNSLSTPLIIIPKTYYFKIIGASEKAYEIKYNDHTFWCERSVIDSSNATAKKTDLTQITTPHYQIALAKIDRPITWYIPGDFTEGSTILNNTVFLGYIINNGEYYFTVLANLGASTTQMVLFVKADVYVSNFSSKNIPLHPNSSQLKRKEIEQQTTLAQNELKRNIFFVVICFVCLVSVFLIYNPFKKKNIARNQPSYSSEDDF